jgi:hypothetical protein
MQYANINGKFREATTTETVGEASGTSRDDVTRAGNYLILV